MSEIDDLADWSQPVNVPTVSLTIDLSPEVVDLLTDAALRDRQSVQLLAAQILTHTASREYARQQEDSNEH